MRRSKTLLYKLKMPGNKPRSQYKKKRSGFNDENPLEKNRTTDSGCG